MHILEINKPTKCTRGVSLACACIVLEDPETAWIRVWLPASNRIEYWGIHYRVLKKTLFKKSQEGSHKDKGWKLFLKQRNTHEEREGRCVTRHTSKETITNILFLLFFVFFSVGLERVVGGRLRDWGTRDRMRKAVVQLFVAFGSHCKT